MLRFFKIILTGIITSFYFFPFIFKAFPLQNTKNILAAVGVIVLLIQLSRKRRCGFCNKDIINLMVIAAVVSLIGLFSVAINETPDYSYATYIISMCIWMSGAYVVTTVIRWVHGECSFILLLNYLVGVCVVQCLLAILIDCYIPFKVYVDANIEQDQAFLNKVERLYGIGASLDVAGSRFAAVLAMMSFALIWIKDTLYKNYITIYIISFIIIAVIGNMIARTTIVGLGLAIIYLLWNFFGGRGNKQLWRWLAGILMVSIPVMVFMYNNNIETRNLFRFAFEGFFSLWEKGRWEVASNDRLMEVMVVFPDNLKTWLIGDGYFSSPRDTDPYFIGKIVGGYYMGTDIGYLRFIFYFGLIGLLSFMAYFCRVTQICIKNLKRYKVLFLALLAINFIVWFKVATDIFLVFALFLMIDSEEDEKYNSQIMLENEDSI